MGIFDYEEEKIPMTVNIIAAMAPNGVIGNENRIPWRSKEDMKFFKEMTMGAPIIMGRKTWDSFPKKPLPGRLNIVLTKNDELIGLVGDAEEGPIFMHELTAALTMLDDQGFEEVYIIGGSAIYEKSLSLDLVDRMFINVMNLDEIEGDAYFPYIEESMWTKEESDTQFNDFTAYLYERKREEEIPFDA
jgi:dihydrofolate reductase